MNPIVALADAPEFPTPRRMPEIVRDLGALRVRHADLVSEAASGQADAGSLEMLAIADAELRRFEDLCVARRRLHLMSAGLRWGDELSHPAAPGLKALVRLADLVEIDGREMDLLAATRLAAETSGTGAAMGAWIRPDGFPVGPALGLVHPDVDAPAPSSPPSSANASSDEAVPPGGASVPSGRAPETEATTRPPSAKPQAPRPPKPADDRQIPLF